VAIISVHFWPYLRWNKATSQTCCHLPGKMLNSAAKCADRARKEHCTFSGLQECTQSTCSSIKLLFNQAAFQSSCFSIELFFLKLLLSINLEKKVNAILSYDLSLILSLFILLQAPKTIARIHLLLLHLLLLLLLSFQRMTFFVFIAPITHLAAGGGRKGSRLGRNSFLYVLKFMFCHLRHFLKTRNNARLVNINERTDYNSRLPKRLTRL
jgi:hypothetical protein